MPKEHNLQYQRRTWRKEEVYLCLDCMKEQTVRNVRELLFPGCEASGPPRKTRVRLTKKNARAFDVWIEENHLAPGRYRLAYVYGTRLCLRRSSSYENAFKAFSRKIAKLEKNGYKEDRG